MTHLLIFTIGPVQSFIASARKTQDLFAGSAILSNLVIDAYNLLQQKISAKGGACELVFPHIDAADSKQAANPNRFAAIIRGNNLDLRTIVGDVKKEVTENYFLDKALTEIRNGLTVAEQTTLLKAGSPQLEYLPEIYWGALPVMDDLSDYADVYAELESLIGGTKNIRHLRQLEEAGRKCSVDGVHNVIVYRKSKEDENLYKLKFRFQPEPPIVYLEPSDESKVKIWEISPGEGLSAVSFYKRRYYTEPHEFPSTARVALMHILENPEIKGSKEDLSESWEEYRNLASLIGTEAGNKFGLHSDDQLYYEENITPDNLRDFGIQEGDLSDARTEIKAAHKALRDRLEEDGKDPLTSKYYALLIFDGDQMGKWLSGSFLTNKGQLKDFQENLRNQLKTFAAEARAILKPPFGKTVYAAGEDFMGFVNLHYLFDVLSKLRNKFDETVSQPLFAEDNPITLKTQEVQCLSFSAGIAIAHYKQPLPTVLDEAKRAERRAKDEGGNRFCISAMRHSGGITRCVVPFMDNAIPAYFSTIMNQIGNDNSSNKFIHQLMREMRLWDIVETEMFTTEANRLIRRANNTKVPNDITDMENALADLVTTAEENGNVATEKVFSILRVADFILRNQKGGEQ